MIVRQKYKDIKIDTNFFTVSVESLEYQSTFDRGKVC